ncbi:MAG: transposase [Cyanobacteria bacterium P01_D01_bin.156]
MRAFWHQTRFMHLHPVMRYNPDKHHRRSIRLKGYDYSSPGGYFLTLCTHERKCLFGEIQNGRMILSDWGAIVAEEWKKSAQIRQEIELDVWVVMPNHFHGIVFITDVGVSGDSSQHPHRTDKKGIMPLMKPKSISSLMAGFKSATTKRINQLRNASVTPVWQRNYHDRIIRDEAALQTIRQYVRNNPQQWQIDQMHPENPSK